MAYSASGVLEIRTGGSATNGGGFDSSVASAGTDYSLQDGAQVAVTDGVTDGVNPTITSVTGGFTVAMIGNYAYFAGGTGSLTAKRRIITGVPDGNTLTIDIIPPEASTGVTVNVGGALSTLADVLVGSGAVFVGSSTTTTLTVASMTSGYITPGMTITGTGVTANSYIQAQLTGTPGGAGTYLISPSQTIGAATTITGTGAPIVPGGVVYMKNGTYTLTSTIAPFVICGLPGKRIKFVGYNVNRTLFTTDATRPLLTTATDSTALVSSTVSSNVLFRNINCSNTASVRSNGFIGAIRTSGFLSFKYCTFTGFTNGIFGSGGVAAISQISVFRCDFDSCSVSGVTNSLSPSLTELTGNIFRNCGSGYITGAQIAYLFACRNIFAVSTGKAISFTSTSLLQLIAMIENNVFYNNTTSGITDAATVEAGFGQPAVFKLMNNVFWGGVDGINIGAAALSERGIASAGRNAFGGQSGSARVNFNATEGDITLTADPFVNGASYDFTPNRTAGGGQLLRDAGFPDTVPTIGTISLLDVGAVNRGNRETTTASVG